MSLLCVVISGLAMGMNAWLVVASYITWRRAGMFAFVLTMMGVAVLSSGVVASYIYDWDGWMMILLVLKQAKIDRRFGHPCGVHASA
jgi:hypothetical protein